MGGAVAWAEGRSNPWACLLPLANAGYQGLGILLGLGCCMEQVLIFYSILQKI